MPHEIGADGKLYVWVDAGRTGADHAGVDEAGHGAAAGRDELVEVLREQLQAERQAHAEARRLLMAALERIPPAIEAPREPPQTPAEEAEGTDTPSTGGASPAPPEGSQRRSWLHRFFFGE
jgi:hypothetical protein